MTSLFAIRGLKEQRTSILGIWEPFSPTSFALRDSAFPGSGTAADGEEVVWSVSLPGNPTLASETVQHQAKSLQTVQRAIARGTPTLRELPARWLETPSFAVEHATDSTNPEATLWRHLAQLHGGEEAVSFGLGLPGNWSQMVADFQAFTQQVLQLLKPTVRVETIVEGALQAYTRVGVTGDFETFWYSHATWHHTKLHQHIISVTLESRLAMLQLLAQSTAGAAILAARFSLPGGAFIALPATWRYLQDVIAQGKKLAALHDQID